MVGLAVKRQVFKVILSLIDLLEYAVREYIVIRYKRYLKTILIQVALVCHFTHIVAEAAHQHHTHHHFYNLAGYAPPAYPSAQHTAAGGRPGRRIRGTPLHTGLACGLA